MPLKNLDEQIVQTEKLHELRQRAWKLHSAATKILAERPYSEDKKAGWREPGDAVEQALILLALQRDASDQAKKKCAEMSDKIFELKLEAWDVLKTPPSPASDRVPIFRAAQIVQSFASDPAKVISKVSLFCLHRIIREIYEVVSPTWAAGAARAGGEVITSAFISAECARAVLSFSYFLRRTAEAAELLGKAARLDRVPDDGLQSWLKQEKNSRLEWARVSLNALRPDLIVEDKLIPLVSLQRLREPFQIPPGLRTELEGLFDRVAHGSDAIEKFNKEAAGKIATETITQLFESFANVIKAGEAKDEFASGREIASTLKGAAQKLRQLADPVEHFASAVIDRELARSSPHLARVVDAAELIFATNIFGRLSGWGHPKVKSGLELARTLVDADGHVLSLRPFDIESKGYRLHVASLEIPRRLAELIANVVDVEIEPEFVECLMRPFEDTRAFSQDGSEPGWATDPPGPKRESEWWVTALAADALDKVVEMLNEAINRQILRHFSVRQPFELKLGLDALFYPDYGLSARGDSRGAETKNLAFKLQHLRSHAGVSGSNKDPLFSLVLYGPPGTGKTTLVEATAKSAEVPLVEITPSDILVGGADAVERRTRLVFNALSMLTHVVILFDEFDSILQDRRLRESARTAPTVFDFLTPGLLPKLKKLHDSAKDQQVSYVLATNFVDRLDPAAVRQGRFDDKHGVYPPDVVSRVGRLLDQFQSWAKKRSIDFNNDRRERLLEAARQTAGAPMEKLGKPGWYTAPAGDSSERTLFHYIQNGGSLPAIQAEASYEIDWADRREETKNPEEYDRYWTDWETLRTWDDALAKATGDFDWDEVVNSAMLEKQGSGKTERGRKTGASPQQKRAKGRATIGRRTSK